MASYGQATAEPTQADLDVPPPRSTTPARRCRSPRTTGRGDPEPAADGTVSGINGSVGQ